MATGGQKPKIPDTTRRGVPRPGDDARHGDWSRARLEQMDQKFCKRLTRAMRDGREHMPEMSRSGHR